MTYTGRPRGSVTDFYAQGGVSDNGCAQAAVAAAVREYGVGKYADQDDRYLVTAIWSEYKPDTPNQWFGTTPGYLEKIAKAAGLKPWRTYGDGNARNALQKTITEGGMMICLVDLGKTGGDWFQWHYVVAYAFDDDHVHVTNLIGARGSAVGDASFTWAEFMEAWHCWTLNLPELQYAGVAVFG